MQCITSALHSIGALLPHCTTMPLHYRATALPRHCTTTPLHYHATALLRHCTTAPLHYCATALLRHCITDSLLDFILLKPLLRNALMVDSWGTVANYSPPASVGQISLMEVNYLLNYKLFIVAWWKFQYFLLQPTSGDGWALVWPQDIKSRAVLHAGGAVTHSVAWWRGSHAQCCMMAGQLRAVLHDGRAITRSVPWWQGNHAQCAWWQGIHAQCCTMSESEFHVILTQKLRSYTKAILQLQAWVSANWVLKDWMIKVYLWYRMLMKY